MDVPAQAAGLQDRVPVARVVGDGAGLGLHERLEGIEPAAVPVARLPPEGVEVEQLGEAPVLREGQHGLRLGLRGRRGAAVGRAADARARTAGRVPAEGVVAVEIDPDALREHAAVLAPHVVAAKHVLVPVGVPDRGDPDLVAVDQLGDGGRAGVAAGQALDRPQRDHGRHQLAGVVRADEQDVGLVLVDDDVVGDLDGEQVPPLRRRRRPVLRRQVDHLGDGRKGRFRAVHLGVDLVQGRVVLLVAPPGRRPRARPGSRGTVASARAASSSRPRRSRAKSSGPETISSKSRAVIEPSSTS